MPKQIALHDVLGLKGKDLITGNKGVIESTNYSFVGNIQYGIALKARLGNVNPDTYSYDYQQVKVYKESFLNKRMPIIPAIPKFALGQPVACTTTSKVYGYIHRISIFANGCVAYTINQFEVDKIEASTQHLMFEPMLTAITEDDPSYENVTNFIDDAAIQLPVQYQPDTSEKRKTSGGPATQLQLPV